VQSLALVLLFFGGRCLWPDDDGQLGQAEMRRDVLVRVGYPGGRPDQLAGKCPQADSVLGVDPGQEGIGAGFWRWGRLVGPILLRRAAEGVSIPS
jgi:hypothetical protein